MSKWKFLLELVKAKGMPVHRSAQPVVAFDTLTLDAAAKLNGQRVTVVFTVGAYTWVVDDTL